MANHIVLALKRFALSTAIRFLPASEASLRAPEPLRRFADDESWAGEADAWLFDGQSTPVSSAATLLAGELNRVSSALTELRSILAELSRITPLETVPVNAVEAPNFAWAEDVLFDGDAVAHNDMPSLEIGGDAAFLFEDEPAPANWTVLRPGLFAPEAQHPA
ncbi:MAG: hypothetical protein MRY64_08220 [Hyphomonadaceae bacterium]|nr:hypothetical protein [Hyphomonadaceae bacterium]